MDRLLEGKVALITGAGSGIGRASAQLFAREGARVLAADINEAGGAQTVAKIREAGGEAVFMRCDVTRREDVRALVAAAIETYGGLHCAHNNAGIEGEYARTLETTEDNFDRTLAVNLNGVFNCMQAEIAHMIGNGGGRIVNTASIAGLQGVRHMPAYVASKHAVMGLTRTAALEYASRGISVNAVCPGPIRTPMLAKLTADNPKVAEATLRAVPMRRLGEPEDIAEAAVWLCSPRAAFVTGHGLVVDGGMTAGT